MTLPAEQMTALLEALAVQLEDLDALVPDGETIDETVAVVVGRLLSEMQAALRPEIGELSSPLPDELFGLLTTGVIAELLLLGYRHLNESEKAWPAEWRARFERGLAAMASGVDQLADGSYGAAGRFSSEPRRFTSAGLDKVL